MSYCSKEKPKTKRPPAPESQNISNIDDQIHYEVITNNNYSNPDKFNSYDEAKQYYVDCKEWLRDSEIVLRKVMTEALESEFIAWENE